MFLLQTDLLQNRNVSFNIIVEISQPFAVNNMTAQYGINGKEEVIRGGYNVKVKKATSIMRLVWFAVLY